MAYMKRKMHITTKSSLLCQLNFFCFLFSFLWNKYPNNKAKDSKEYAMIQQASTMNLIRSMNVSMVLFVMQNNFKDPISSTS